MLFHRKSIPSISSRGIVAFIVVLAKFFVGLHPSLAKILVLPELANFSEGELLAQQQQMKAS